MHYRGVRQVVNCRGSQDLQKTSGKQASGRVLMRDLVGHLLSSARGKQNMRTMKISREPL
jgi:hypothetical protein